MNRVLTIGKFELVSEPGQLIRRRRARSWFSVVFLLTVVVLALVYRSYYHAALWGALACLDLLSKIADKPEKRNPTPIMQQRDGRWIVRETDAGPVAGAKSFVKQDGDRWLVMLTWPNRNYRPVLIWWTKKQADADRLWDLIAPILQSGPESAMPIAAAAEAVH